MSTRLSRPRARRRQLRWLIGVAASACMLSACTSSVPRGEPPRTPEQLVALVKQIADSGRLKSPESVAQMLGTTLYLAKHNPNELHEGCNGSTSPGRLVYSDYILYAFAPGFLAGEQKFLLAENPVVRGPLPHLDTGPDRLFAKYELTTQQDCSESLRYTSATLSIYGLLEWKNITLDDLQKFLPEGHFASGVDFSASFYYDAPQPDTTLQFGLAYSKSGFRLSDIRIAKSHRFERYR